MAHAARAMSVIQAIVALTIQRAITQPQSFQAFIGIGRFGRFGRFGMITLLYGGLVRGAATT
jgi:hypothetical protein